MAEALNIFYGDQYVGQLVRTSSMGYELRYDFSEEKDPPALSVNLPPNQDKYFGPELHNFLSNLLPDDSATRQRISNEFQGEIETDDPFDLLKVMGSDCVGAFQFLPVDKEPDKGESVEGEVVTEDEIAEIVHKMHDADEEMTPLGLEEDFRISLAGKNDKTAYLKHEGKWKKPHGTSPTTHIFKPSMNRPIEDSAANEHFCMTLARNLNLNAANTRLKEYDGVYCLIAERFDRTDDYKRRHHEDFCQVLNYPPGQKYEHPKDNDTNEPGPSMHDCLEFLEEALNAARSQYELIASQIYFWLIGATDGHAKNFSIQYPLESSGIQYHLAPIYDVMSKAPFKAKIRQKRGVKSKNPGLRLAMSVGIAEDYKDRNFRIQDISPTDFYNLAQYNTAEYVTEEKINGVFEGILENIDDVFKKTVEDMPEGFPARIHKAIKVHIEKRKQEIEQDLN